MIIFCEKSKNCIAQKVKIYKHYSGELVFEYNKDKEVDKEAYREFEEVWVEVKSY